MTVRPPKALSPTFSTTGAFNVLEYELMSERADALGRHGLKVEKAVAALSELKAEVAPDLRERLLDEAADAVWAFFIQREICGLRDTSRWNTTLAPSGDHSGANDGPVAPKSNVVKSSWSVPSALIT